MFKIILVGLIFATTSLAGVTVYNQTNKNLRLVHIHYSQDYVQHQQITDADLMAGAMFNDCFVTSFLVMYIDEIVLDLNNFDGNGSITIIEKDDSGEFLAMSEQVKEDKCTNSCFCSLW